PGALKVYSEMFEDRRMEKFYLAAVHGVPKQQDWTCALPLIADASHKGRMRVATPDQRSKRPRPRSVREEQAVLVKDAETHFHVLETSQNSALIEARPVTGRTHQIRVHLAAAGHPVIGDPLYGPDAAAISKGRQRLALRASRLFFRDPFQRRPIH